ncbi:SMP-30/gluconolactonase/LRE family protein [Mucilaginibacter boryungensis]|uniref:SMP-30/gluconolactonase/LRE family protein n=1 Tax=Mucilaginibacter boryungensis TaxID=768480 RepID=A0ABR9XH71_9SPHI|nr:SMP-30/gluconolactonase/LRE family protein [Mucilaginibacter boryungensis]MBE9666414.1 SMP-30/gluconolactonase/LRE family protein [Mucilaginibacter boryungensis]
MKKIIFTIIACAFTCNVLAQGKLLYDTLQKPQLISKQFNFTEGPAVDKKGNIFFTDQPDNKIWKYDTEGKLSVFMDKAGRSNGIFFDKKGNLISCADEQDQLWSINKHGKVTVLVNDFDGHRLNGPNDLWVNRKTGGIYFTDPYYQRDYWDRKTSDLDGQKVYYLPPNGSPVIADDQLKKPNGIVGTPDGNTLYVADIQANKTYKYSIAADGKLTNKQLLINQGSDGMTIDAEGNIYLTGKGVTVYDPSGKKIAHIDIPEPWTANICFGGRDRKLLFITASTAIYTLRMNVKGVE